MLVPRVALAEGNDDAPRLLLAGEYHGDEVLAGSGDEWLALVPARGGGFELVRCRVDVTAVEDPVVDGPGEKTGKRVRARIGSTPLFLVRESDRVRPGATPTLVSEETTVSDAPPVTLELTPGTPVRLGLHFGNGSGAEGVGCELRLVSAGVTQRLREYAGCIHVDGGASVGSESMVRLLWAGDLDHDGRLDLLVDLSDHYNVSAPTMLLSSEAGPGELVGEAGSFVTMGC